MTKDREELKELLRQVEELQQKITREEPEEKPDDAPADSADAINEYLSWYERTDGGGRLPPEKKPRTADDAWRDFYNQPVTPRDIALAKAREAEKKS